MGGPFKYANGSVLPIAVYGKRWNREYVWAAKADSSALVLELTELTKREMELTHVDRRGDVIYLSYSSRMSAKDMDSNNGYLAAVDAKTGDLLWQSQPLVANSRNFELVDGVLFSGYGFTAEDDFIYAIDAQSGRVLAKVATPTATDYLIYEDDTLYVRTYNRDLEVDVTIERK